MRRSFTGDILSADRTPRVPSPHSDAETATLLHTAPPSTVLQRTTLSPNPLSISQSSLSLTKVTSEQRPLSWPVSAHAQSLPWCPPAWSSDGREPDPSQVSPIARFASHRSLACCRPGTRPRQGERDGDRAGTDGRKRCGVPWLTRSGSDGRGSRCRSCLLWNLHDAALPWAPVVPIG